jgi:hypothetical protein
MNVDGFNWMLRNLVIHSENIETLFILGNSECEKKFLMKIHAKFAGRLWVQRLMISKDKGAK